MSPDPLTDTLSLIDARCLVSGGFTAGGVWGLRFWPQAPLKLVAVVRGSCWLAVEGEGAPVLLEAGDAAVINGWRQVILASSPDSEPVDMTEAFTSSETAVVSVSDDDSVAVVGGHIEVNQAGEDLLLAVLPAITHIRGAAEEAHAIGWLLERILREMTTSLPGAAFAAHQHAQLLLLEVFRAYLVGAESFPPGWLRAIADERLAPALRAMHEDVSRSWSLDELASLCAMSRSSFVDRFRAASGVPPMTYLHQWRIRLAQRELRVGDAPLARLAPMLGYGSESAFSNAFKRTTGRSPRAYREEQRLQVAR
jgi:AraC-like DNA-binding protein